MTKLERISHICLITVSCVALGLLVEARFRGRTQGGPQELPNPVGQSLSLPGVAWKDRPFTVVLHLSSKCHYCDESMPFYQDLAATRQRVGHTAIIVASPDPVRVMQEHLAEKQVTVDRVLHARLDSIGVVSTPTVLIVDAKGVVKEAFVGKLGDADGKKVLQIVAKGKA